MIALFLSSSPERRVRSSIFSISSVKELISFLISLKNRSPPSSSSMPMDSSIYRSLFSIVSKGKTVFSSLDFSLRSSLLFSGEDQTCSSARSSVILWMASFFLSISKITS